MTLRDNQICNDEKTACVIVSLRQLSSGRDRFKAILFVAAFPSRLSRYTRRDQSRDADADGQGERRRDAAPIDDLIRLDRKRKSKKLSNDDWTSKTDPDAKIAKMKDGSTRLAYANLRRTVN